MDKIVLKDKISGAEASIGFTGVQEIPAQAQTTRLHVQSMAKALELLNIMRIDWAYITIVDDDLILIRKEKNSLLCIAVSPFAALNNIS